MKEKEPLEQAGQSEQQRKQATVLFVDIAGHTRLIHNLDPEDNMEIIDRALVRLADPVKRFGGHITRYQGDGFKAVFGLPMAQENDPERAVQAGLAILAGPHSQPLRFTQGKLFSRGVREPRPSSPTPSFHSGQALLPTGEGSLGSPEGRGEWPLALNLGL